TRWDYDPGKLCAASNLLFKGLLRACPHHGFSELHQLDTFYNALNSKDQDSLNSVGSGNFLDKIPRECLAIIESKSKVRFSRNKPVVAKTRSSSRLVSNPSSNPTPSTNLNPKGRNRRRSKQRIEEFNLEELSPPIVTMADQHIMAKLLQASTEGYEDAIVVPAITADNFELKHGRFDESFSEAWDRFKGLHRACPHHGFSELHQLDTFYNALNSKDQDSLNFIGSGNFLDKIPRECLAIIESKSKVRFSRNKPVVAKVSMNTSTFGISLDVAEFKDMVKALLLDKKSQNQAPATVKAVKESYVTCDGDHSYRNYPATDGNVYRDNIQEFISHASAVNYNQRNTSYRPPMMRNDERNREKANNQIEKFCQIFKDMSFEISLADALILMPKFASTLKALIENKEKLSEMARTPLNEHCSAVLLKKLPEKLGDPGKFLISCDFLGIDKCLALADLSASINLMPLSEVIGFSDVIASGNPIPYYDPIVSTTSPTLTPFENSDFLLEEVDAFLALKDGPTTPKVDQSAKSDKSSIDEPPEVELKDSPPHLEYAFLEGDDKFPFIITKDLSVEEKTALITVLKSHKRAIAWKLSDINGGFTVVENEENALIPTRLVMSWCVCIEYRKLNEATHKDHFPLPFMDQMLERLARNQYYCFLDSFSGYFQIPIDPKDQEKTIFTYPYVTFAYCRMPFGLCNAPGTFQSCLSHLEKILKMCEDINLSLNWEKSHFMVKKGIVLGHKISKEGIKVDKAKVDVITKLPYPTTVKGIRSFLGHDGFYRRFIKDFSKIARLMTRPLENNTLFIFSKECVEAFQTLKRKLTEAPILIASEWEMPFEIMCDARDFVIGAVLGQRQEKHFRPIHYASKTITEAESNYTTTEKEMLVVVYAFEIF
nr:reverse transcriptase domain-containing protein [Tanacetum cinerariifolium]